MLFNVSKSSKDIGYLIGYLYVSRMYQISSIVLILFLDTDTFQVPLSRIAIMYLKSSKASY